MSKVLDLYRWKRIEKKLRAARVKRETLTDDNAIDTIDEYIWKLQGEYAEYVLKYYGDTGVSTATSSSPKDTDE